MASFDDQLPADDDEDHDLSLSPHQWSGAVQAHVKRTRLGGRQQTEAVEDKGGSIDSSIQQVQ